jgi:hypothetical protein
MVGSGFGGLILQPGGGVSLDEGLQFLGLGKAWRGLEGRIQANPSTLVLNVDETPQLWPEENTRAGIPDGQIRQVG